MKVFGLGAECSAFRFAGGPRWICRGSAVRQSDDEVQGANFLLPRLSMLAMRKRIMQNQVFVAAERGVVVGAELFSCYLDNQEFAG